MAYLGKRDRQDENNFAPPQKRPGFNGGGRGGNGGGRGGQVGKFGGNFGAPAYAPRGATRPPGGYGVPGFASRGGRPPFDAPRPPFDSKFEGGRPNFEHGPRTQDFNGGRFEGPLRQNFEQGYPGAYPGPMNRGRGEVPGGGAGPNQALEETPSNVLIFTVHNAKYPITVDVMHTICTNSGAVVNRIVILRKHAIQVMVEFGNVQEAESLRESLNGADIYSGCCTLKIEHAKMTRLTVNKNDQDSWDYTEPSNPEQRLANIIKDSFTSQIISA